jgi:hypothetical protein
LAKHKICQVKFGKLLQMLNSNSLANQLGIYLILAKQEKLVSNSLTNQLGKTHHPACIYAHADRAFPCRWEGKKGNKEYRRISEVSFQEVEEHKLNFVSLRIPDAS